VQARGLNTHVNHEELMDHVKLRRHLKEAEVARIAKAGQLTVLMGGISKVLVELGMPPIPWIPQEPGTAGDILETVGTVLEHLREANASNHGPGE
jgi:hypothetical protein